MPLAYCHSVGKQIRYSARDQGMHPSQSLGFAYCDTHSATLDEVYQLQLPYSIVAKQYSQRKLLIIFEAVYRLGRFLKL